MLTEGKLQDIVDGKTDVPLADALILWNEAEAADYGPVGVLVLPQPAEMDDRTSAVFDQVADQYINSRGNCTSSWVDGDTKSRLAELREIAANMVADGLPEAVVRKGLSVIPEWRNARC